MTKFKITVQQYFKSFNKNRRQPLIDGKFQYNLMLLVVFEFRRVAFGMIRLVRVLECFVNYIEEYFMSLSCHIYDSILHLVLSS